MNRCEGIHPSVRIETHRWLFWPAGKGHSEDSNTDCTAFPTSNYLVPGSQRENRVFTGVVPRGWSIGGSRNVGGH